MFTSFLTDCSIFFSAFSLPASPHLTTLKNILHIRVLESPRSQKLSNRHCYPPLSDTIVRKLLQLSVTHCSIPLSRLKNIHHFCQMSIEGAKSPWHCRPPLTDLIFSLDVHLLVPHICDTSTIPSWFFSSPSTDIGFPEQSMFLVASGLSPSQWPMELLPALMNLIVGMGKPCTLISSSSLAEMETWSEGKETVAKINYIKEGHRSWRRCNTCPS